MSQSSNVTRVEISAEMKARLDSLTDSPTQEKKFKPEVDAILLEYWPKKNKTELAKMLGFSDTTLRKRYRELTNGD